MPCREGGLAVPEDADRRNGGDPRYRPLRSLHLAGARRVGPRRDRAGPRRARRPDGAGRIGDDRGRDPARGAPHEAEDPQARAANALRRRRARGAPRHVGLVRTRRGGSADGRRDLPRPEARAALYRVPRGRIRDPRALHGRAREARRRRGRGDRRAQADARREEDVCASANAVREVVSILKRS